MTAKQYLRQAYRLNQLIESDIHELEQLRALSKSISSPNLTGMPTAVRNKSDASYTDIINKIIDLEHRINREIDSYIDLKGEIRTAIDNVADTDQRLCLRLRYLHALKWDGVCAEMGVSLRRVYDLHEAGIKAIKVP